MFEVSRLVQETDGTQFGIEFESQYVDEDFQEVPRAADAIAYIRNSLPEPIESVSEESKKSIMETVTRPLPPVEFPAAIREARNVAAYAGKRNRMVPIFSSVPVNLPPDGIPVSEGPAYQTYEELYQEAMRRNDTTGVHLHVGVGSLNHVVESEKVRVALYNRMRPYLPVLIAMSAGSPIHRRRLDRDRNRNRRMQLFSDIPATGHDPGPFSSIEGCVEWSERQVDRIPGLRSALGTPAFRGKTARNVVYPMMRIHPTYPTLELRMLTNGLTPQHSLWSTSFAAGIAKYELMGIAEGRPAPEYVPKDLTPWIEAAFRHGQRAMVLNPFDTTKTVVAGDAMRQTLEHVDQAFKELGIPVDEMEALTEAVLANSDTDHFMSLVWRARDGGVEIDNDFAARIIRGDEMTRGQAATLGRFVAMENYAGRLVDTHWANKAMPSSKSRQYISQATGLQQSVMPVRSASLGI